MATTTSYMGLSLPVPTVTIGPEWAIQLNLALTAVDAHDHSVGKGAKITPLGLNINSDLSIGGNNLNSVKSARFSNNSVSLGGASDLRSVYVFDDDLYYNNEAGTAIQLTSGNYINGPSIGAFTPNRVITTDNLGLFIASLGAANEALLSNGTQPGWGKIANANVDSAAAIAYSKLALTNSILNADINSSAAIAYSKLNLAGSIVNADISASAAIAYSKLALTNSILNADINSSAAIAYSKLSLTGAIVNADISNSAAIAYSKLALTGTIVNADVNASAAIAYSKLALSNSIVNADINSSAAIAYSKLNLSTSIVNADISNSAAIVYTKLSLASSIVNADISNSAAIAYSKLSLTGTVVNADISASAAIAYSKLSLTGAIVNADISTSAAIAYSKLNLAGSVSLSSDVTGTLGLTRGGTGQTTANAALNALLPSQTGNNLKILRTDGTNTSWASVGSGGGSKNYLGNVNGVNGNGDFELGTTSGWSLFNTTLTGVIPTGSISTSSLLGIFQTTTGGSQLAGTYSLSVGENVGGVTAGKGVISDAFTIDQEDKSKVQTFKFYYQVGGTVGAANFSGTSSNTWAVYIYDVTNSAWIQPAGVYSMTQSSGTGIATGTFQTTSNSTQYRLAIIAINSTASSSSLILDDFSVGPLGAAADARVPAAVIGGTSTQTITSAGGNQQVTSFTASSDTFGAFASNAYVVPISGFYFVTATLPWATQASSARAFASLAKNGSPLVTGQQINLSSSFNITTTVTTVQYFNAGDSLTIQANVTVNTALVTGSYWQVFRVAGPTSGDEGRILAVSLSGTATTVNNTFPVITPSTIVKDSSGSFSGSTYTVPVSGWYDIFAYMQSNSVAFTSGNGISIAYKVNGGSTVNLGNTRIPASVTQAFSCSGAGLVYANAGDTIQFAAYSDVSNTPLIFTGSIARRSGPSVPSAADSVNARYYAATATITVSDSTITWSTKDFDSNNAYSSGTYTIPISGKYQINASLYVGGTFALNTGTKISIYKNGSEISAFNHQAGGAISSEQVAIHDEIQCNAGDAITIRIASSATSPVVNASNTKNYFSIARVGN